MTGATLGQVPDPKTRPGRAVADMFSAIASTYDLLNHLLSGGVDFYWRRRAVETLRTLKPRRILDVATGTADFAIATLRLNPEQIVGVDISENMLNIGRSKLVRRHLNNVISLESGMAESLEFPDASFDAAIVAFGARNFEHLEQGLSEMRRVLRGGGRIVVLEFSRPSVFPFKQLYFFYFKRILPLVGRIVSKHHEAYTYLPDSVLRFPEGKAFCAILEHVGFRNVTEERLTFGIATIYTATATS